MSLDPMIMRTAAVTASPLETMLRFERTDVNRQVLAAAEAANVDGAPVLTDVPGASGQVLRSGDGSTWFVPVAVLPKMSSSSSTPNVFFDDPGGTWVLRVTIDLVRPDGAPETAQPLPVDSLAIALSSSTSVTFTDLVDAPAPDPGVVRRIVASAPVDRDAVVSALDGVPTSTFTVLGTVHYRTPVAATPVVVPDPDPDPDPEPGPPFGRGFPRGGVVHANLHPFLLAQASPEPVQLADFRTFRVADRLRRWPVVTNVPTGAPAPMARQLALTAGGVPISAYFPKSTPAYRRIYARALTGIAGDPNAVWVPQGSGFWREAVAPGEFYTTPQEYRLAIDAETGMPAMAVLLVSTPRPDGKTDYRVRVRFVVAPWLDPKLTAATRAGIEQHEGLTFPRLVVGGVDRATFSASGLLNQLGASILSSGGGDSAPTAPDGGTPPPAASLSTVVDPAGFELVFDCTLEFYTLLANLMTGKAGVVSGIEGEVALSLVTGDQPTDVRQVRVPVHLRLDRWAGSILTMEAGDPPAEGATSLQVGVVNHSAYPVTVGSMLATLVATIGEPPVPLDTAPGICQPAALALPAHVPGVVPVPVTLTTTDDLPLASVDVVDLAFVDLAVQVDPAQALSKIHELGTSGTISTTVTVRSYLLAHPETLPPAVADVFGLEVQVDRGSGTPLTVVITRDEPQKTTDVAFSFGDLLAGIRPDTPELKVRRRNLVPTGTSDWGEWESVVGRELFLSPVLPATAATTTATTTSTATTSSTTPA